MNAASDACVIHPANFGVYGPLNLAALMSQISGASPTVSGAACGLLRRRTPDRGDLLENGPQAESADGTRCEVTAAENLLKILLI